MYKLGAADSPVIPRIGAPHGKAGRVVALTETTGGGGRARERAEGSNVKAAIERARKYGRAKAWAVATRLRRQAHSRVVAVGATRETPHHAVRRRAALSALAATPERETEEEGGCVRSNQHRHQS